MMLSILVTGASGFIGRDLVRRLAVAGHRVRAAARNPAAVSDLPCEPVRLDDLAGKVAWPALLGGITHVVHLAGIAHTGPGIPEASYKHVNAEATATLAAAARDAGVRRVVLVSSVRAQTGPTADKVLTEREPPAPTDAYGRSKLAAEAELAHVLAQGLPDWVALRPVLLYGEGAKGNMRALARLARTGLPLPLASLTGRRSLLGLANFASAVEHVLVADGASRRVLLVADPGPLTVAELVATLRLARRRSPLLLHVPENVLRWGAGLAGQSGTLDRLTGDLIVDTTALQSTGWCPKETARQGLERWQRETRETWRR
jgi:UDP-glucose 4-epimerase